MCGHQGPHPGRVFRGTDRSELTGQRRFLLWDRWLFVRAADMCGVFRDGNKEVLFRQVENEGLAWVWTGHFTRLSLLHSKRSQAGKPFILLQNLKATFQPMGVKRSTLAANKKSRKHSVVLAVNDRWSYFSPLPLLYCCPPHVSCSSSFPALNKLHIVCRTTHWENEFIPTRKQVVHGIAVCLATAIVLTAVQ